MPAFDATSMDATSSSGASSAGTTPGSAITSLTLTSPLTLGSAAVAVGQGFKKGDIPAGMYLTTGQPNLSCIPLATWNDGSLKHARIVGVVGTTANTPLVLNLSSTSSVPVGTPLTSSNITSANPSASVQCGSLGTVSLSALLSSPVRTVASTPNMVECHYRAAVPGTNLLVWFHVRLFSNNAVYVRAIVENGYLDNGSGAVASNADSSYIPTVTIGGTVVYNNSGASLTHCANTRWKSSGWIGTDPQITPKHDTVYLRATKLVPNYSLCTPSSSQLDSYIQTYTPMSNGNLLKLMATTGANGGIGLLTEWDSAYLQSGDPRAYKAAISSADSLNSFGIVWRDFTNKDIIRPKTFPTWSLAGPGQGNASFVSTSNGCAWEINHHPSLGYFAYLITGDYWHYETLMLQLSLCWVIRGTMSIDDATYGNGTSRIVAGETRGGAWSARTMNVACGIMPDSEKVAGKIGAEYRELLTNNIAYWKSLVDKPGINQLGFLFEYAPGGVMGSYGNGMNAGWQQAWWVQADGFGYDLDPLPDMTVFTAVRDYRYKAIVGMLGDVNTGFPFDCVTVYSLHISASSNKDPTTWYADWRTAAVATFAPANDGGGINSIPHNNTLLNVGDFGASGYDGTLVPSTGGAGAPEEAATGRWGYILPAIAYAAEHGVPGAAESWARVSGASNYSTLTGAFATTASQWGVFPRNVVANGQVTVTMVTVSPLSPSVAGSGSQQFSASVVGTNSPAQTVTWSVTGGGSINTSGLFTAPAATSSAQTITVRATSTVDVTKSGTATVTVAAVAPTPTVTSVAVSPATASLSGGASQTFTATVTGTNSPAQGVAWATSLGTINSSGVFTAPAATGSAQSITITARSTVDSTKTGTATVTVAAASATVSSVSISPSTASVGGGAQQQFIATVTGTNGPAQSVTWSANSGSISTSGLFTAPVATGGIQTIVITATSTADGSKSATATVIVGAATPTVSGVAVSPASATVRGGNQAQFSASVSGYFGPSQAVAWSASAGTITGSGLWTAPPTGFTAQQVTIIATSTFDGTKSGVATITVPAFDVPTAPIGVAATAGMGTVSVVVTPPNSNGGTAITGYQVTASSGQVITSAGNTMTFTLPAFAPVSFTAVAVNAIGPGPASSPSNTVIPKPVESTVPADYSTAPAPRERTLRM